MNTAHPSIQIAPSILSADFSRLGEAVRAIEAAGANFVPNLTIGPRVCEAIRPHVKISIDVYLMVAPYSAPQMQMAATAMSCKRCGAPRRAARPA